YLLHAGFKSTPLLLAEICIFILWFSYYRNPKQFTTLSASGPASVVPQQMVHKEGAQTIRFPLHPLIKKFPGCFIGGPFHLVCICKYYICKLNAGPAVTPFIHRIIICRPLPGGHLQKSIRSLICYGIICSYISEYPPIIRHQKISI